ncbi:MAG TPA: cytochrome b561 domain-containing protein [Dyadobacter sp.]|nr:cytochrome b561 domain-containing protein [Dyadobacter sp.]
MHGILMVIAWCALLFTGSFFSRYLKIVTTAWFKIHVALQTVGVALVLAGFIIIFIAQGGFNLGAHQVIGIIIFGLTMAQPFIGLIADRLFDPSRSKVPAQDQIHWWVGRFLLIIAVVNIFLGIDRMFPISNGAYILYALFAAWTALSVAILIAQEVRVGGAEESDVIDLNGGDAKLIGKILILIVIFVQLVNTLIDNADTKQKSKIAKSTFLTWIIIQISILTVFLVFIGISPTDGSNDFLTAPATCP